MKGLLTVVFIVIASVQTYAQQPFFTTVVDTNRILIGEHVQLRLQAQLPANTDFTWPMLPDTLTGLEVVKTSDVDTSRENATWRLTQDIRLTSFDSGYAGIPPLDLQVGNKTYTSAAIALMVNFPELAGEQEMYDIKDPREAPFNWQQLLIIAGFGLLIALVILVIIYFLRKRRQTGPPAPEYRIPPYDFALMQLRELEKEQLWQNGKVKEFYSRLTDILRLYLEREKGIPAMESTADEVSAQVDELQVSPAMKREVQELMSRSAMVKYAKEKPGAAVNERAVETLRKFLKETKPAEEKDAELSV